MADILSVLRCVGCCMKIVEISNYKYDMHNAELRGTTPAHIQGELCNSDECFLGNSQKLAEIQSSIIVRKKQNSMAFLYLR